MLLLTVAYEEEKEQLIYKLDMMIKHFKCLGMGIGISESIENKMHFIKIICDDNDYSDKFKDKFNLYISNILYDIVVDEFGRKDILKFLSDTYFFLKADEISKLKQLSIEALKSNSRIVDEDSIYCLNKKNTIVDKICDCIEENKMININGFITFRMKEFKEDLECIIDKVVEKYMVEREYDEFVKLLKYFVEIQDSKIDEVNIIIKKNGEYEIRDKLGNNIFEDFISDLQDVDNIGSSNIEDIIISGLITNAPEKIVIHCIENSINRELIETIKNVFTSRVEICSKCEMCKKEKIKEKNNKSRV